jgi:tRNA-dihydrouridine synthase A
MGLASVEQATSLLDRVDGVMLSARLSEPWRLAVVDPLIFSDVAPFTSGKAVVHAMTPYVERELSRGVRLSSITRHMLGLFRGVPGARAFRRHLATEAVKPGAGVAVLTEALAMVVDTDAELAHIAA